MSGVHYRKSFQNQSMWCTPMNSTSVTVPLLSSGNISFLILLYDPRRSLVFLDGTMSNQSSPLLSDLCRKISRRWKSWSDDIEEWKRCSIFTLVRVAEGKEGWRAVIADDSIVTSDRPITRVTDEWVSPLFNVIIPGYYLPSSSPLSAVLWITIDETPCGEEFRHSSVSNTTEEIWFKGKLTVLQDFESGQEITQ